MPASHSVPFNAEELSCLLQLIQLGRREDLTEAGDITSMALVPESARAQGVLVAHQAGVLAGIDAAGIALEEAGSGVTCERLAADSIRLTPGQTVARVTGPMRALLAAERLALNLLARLSGIATLTDQFVQAIAGLRCSIYDTRKTTPGWRALEKYAVRAGGGQNHRLGLYDAVLIKDNHLVAWGRHQARSLPQAIRAARAAVAPGTTVEVEVDHLDQLEAAIAGEPDIVLLDNMDPEQLRRAVRLRNRSRPGILLEASGGITLQSVRELAQSGVDRISVGALTHSPAALDIGLDFVEEPSG